VRIGSRLRKTLISTVLLLTGIAVGVFVLAFIAAGEVYEYQDSFDGVHLPRVDAIVCLAGGRGRIATAGDIWYRYSEQARIPLRGAGAAPAPGRPPVLFFSGMGSQASFGTVARQVRRGVLEQLKPENVIIERESSNTEENALFLARFAKERGWDSILLITSPYHMRRSKLIFERVLLEERHPMQIETLSVFQEPFEPGEWRTSIQGVRVTLTEYLKLLAYRLIWKSG
jgi:uncharacterized SAM-binding protein YcdF (DUF218 family)